MIRPELAVVLGRWREVAAAAGLGALGLWFMALGGLLLIPVGAALLVLALAWGTLAARRMRFGQGVHAPGIVEVDEAQVSYLSPDGGGFVSLSDLVELRLVPLSGRRYWRLKQADGQALLVPVEAQGADRLFDAFAALPGMDSHALVASLSVQAGGVQGTAVAVVGPGPVIWKRHARAAGSRAALT